MKCTMLALSLFLSFLCCLSMSGEEISAEIDRVTLDAWSAPYRNWHYYPDHVLPPKPEDRLNFDMTDCPLVWRHENEWRMFYTGFDGSGYQTALAVSEDLVHWTPKGLVMGFGAPGTFDHGGMAFCGALFDSYDVKGPRTLKRWNGKYWALYSCYPKQGGYEIRPGAQGAAYSEDGETWHRASETVPILSIEGAADWEKDCIYAPWLLEYGGQFWNFYNAAKGNIEQMGLVTGTDMLHWKRYEGNPIIRNGGPESFDEQFCSDGKVLRAGDHWVMFYFGVGRGGAHIMAAFSRDLYHWTSHPDPLYRAGGHPGGLDRKYAHKTSLVYNPENDTFYLFYCAVGDRGRGIGLITSRPLP
jgi:sucrose-6-phosphate hydrolase SacC (GH32 family)